MPAPRFASGSWPARRSGRAYGSASARCIVAEHKLAVLHFSVDSALLRELGERLVGKPHIALAELIKNSYDADATKVIVSFEGDRLSVADNGSGMTFTEFQDYWMRIGSPHKQKIVKSLKFSRPL